MRKVYLDSDNGSVCVNDNSRYRGITGIVIDPFRSRLEERNVHRFIKYTDYYRASDSRFAVLKRKKIKE